MRKVKNQKSLYVKKIYRDASYKSVLMNIIKRGNHKVLARETPRISELIWAKTKFIFVNTENKEKEKYFQKGMFLFGMVKKDAKEYISKKKRIGKKKYPVNAHTNDFNEFVDKDIVGTDLDHAYWRIAFLMGVIKENTYVKGLEYKGYKRVRLMALSNLGKDKEYTIYEGGKATKNRVQLLGDERLKLVYDSIRNRCFKYMTELRKLLGDDFVEYRTDAIYYVNTPDNRKKVEDFCDRRKLLFKHLS